jgi:hypothetical protein
MTVTTKTKHYFWQRHNLSVSMVKKLGTMATIVQKGTFASSISYAVTSPYQYKSAKGGNHCEEFVALSYSLVSLALNK